MSGALGGLRVLEVAEGTSGPYCGKLMAGLGAEVIKIEPPDGDSARRAGPFKNDKPDPEASGLFLYLNTGKKSVVLDLEVQAARDRLRGLAENADLVVENYAPGRLDGLGVGYDDLSGANPRLVMVSITPFGQTGPYRDFLATDMVIHALCGEMYLAGYPDREPLKKGGDLVEYVGGLHGYVGGASALHAREITGRGQHVDVSLQEAGTSVIGLAIQQWAYARALVRRQGLDANPWPTGVWLASNGYTLPHARPWGDWWSLFLKVVDDVPEFADPRFTTADGRAQNAEELDALLQVWLVERTKQEVMRLGQEQSLPFGYIATAPDMLESPQLELREFFVEIDHPATGRLPYPGAPFKSSTTPFQFDRAPTLGEHNEEFS